MMKFLFRYEGNMIHLSNNYVILGQGGCALGEERRPFLV